MRRLVCAALVVASAGALARAGEDVSKTRFWSDNTGGFTIRAELVDCDSTAVTLKLVDGDRVRVPLRRLSAADHEWLKLQNRTTQREPIEVAGVKWFGDLREARSAALGSDKSTDDKPIMCFRALGDLSGFM